MVAFNERRQFFARFQLVGSPPGHPRFTLSEKLRQLENAHTQEWVQEQRQYRDHEQRPPIAKLIANLAGVDQTYIAPTHFRLINYQLFRRGPSSYRTANSS